MIRITEETAHHLDLAERCWTGTLARLSDGDWSAPSGCEAWSNRDLVNHLIGGGVRYTLLLRQADPREVEDTRTQDHLGDDPISAFWMWERSFRHEAATRDLGREVPHRIGSISGAQLVDMRILELALHAADLARGLGVEWPIDSALATHLAVELCDLVVTLGAAGGYRPPTANPAERGTLNDADFILRISGRA